MPDWTRGKRTRVCILLGFILCLTSSFLTFDWTQYYLGVVRISDPELAYTRIAKTLTSFLVFLLVLSIGDDGVRIADTRKLRRAFMAIFAGDLLFLLDEIHPAFDYLAVLVFMIGHILVILRNGQGVWAYLRARSAARHRTIDLVTALGVVLVTAILFVLTLLERLRGSPLLVILVVYAAVLDLSLWTGWASTRAGYFPRRNALLIASGALCFFVGGLPGWVQPDSRTIPGAGDDPVRDLDLLHTGDCAPFPQAWFCPNPQVRVQFRYRSVRPA